MSKFCNDTLTDIQFKNIFVFCEDVYYDDNKTKQAFTIAHCIDLRGVTKVSLTSAQGPDGTYYVISVYVDNNYLAKEYSYIGSGDPKYKKINKMLVNMGGALDIATKVKKAIIHLALLSGANAKDGDVF